MQMDDLESIDDVSMNIVARRDSGMDQRVRFNDLIRK